MAGDQSANAGVRGLHCGDGRTNRPCPSHLQVAALGFLLQTLRWLTDRRLCVPGWHCQGYSTESTLTSGLLRVQDLNPRVAGLQAPVFEGCIVEVVAQRDHVQYIITNSPDAVDSLHESIRVPDAVLLYPSRFVPAGLACSL